MSIYLSNEGFYFFINQTGNATVVGRVSSSVTGESVDTNHGVVFPIQVTYLHEDFVDGVQKKESVTYQITEIGNGKEPVFGMETVTRIAFSHGNKITQINDYAFMDMAQLTCSLSLIPCRFLVSIGKNAFKNCSGMEGGIRLPNSVTIIGSGIFQGCSGFKQGLVLPTHLKYIPSSAFEGCSGLMGSIYLPAEVVYIESHAFKNCSSLNGIVRYLARLHTLPKLKIIHENAFEGCSNLHIPNEFLERISCNGHPLAFKENTKILCFQNNQEVYLPIQDIRVGTLVKTVLNGYIEVERIGKKAFVNSKDESVESIEPVESVESVELAENQKTYEFCVYSKTNHPDLSLTDDLYLNRSVYILVSQLTPKEKEMNLLRYGKLIVINHKYRVMCSDHHASMAYQEKDNFNTYSLALKNQHPYATYGIYANGLMVESSSLFSLNNHPNVKWIENEDKV